MSSVTDSMISAVAERRSIYSLSNESTISEKRLEELVQKVLLAVPSAFNTQSTRIVVLLGDQHKKLWDIVRGILAPHVKDNEAKAAATEQRTASFAAGFGSILFFEDLSPYDALQAFASYKDKFESWCDQTSGMHQLLLWTALEVEGMGANVQHYNPLIDEEVHKVWKLDSKWRLVSQMVIGKPVGDRPQPKEKNPVEERYRIIS
jgi:predicted oxidoreductase (fatty acid repression mutant protein)